MKGHVVVVVLGVLAGCQSTENLRARVGNASAFQLCHAMFMAPQDVASIAREEAARRSLDCAPYASAVLQNEHNADAARNALAMQLLSPRPAPPMPQTINCNSYRLGNTVQTDCR